MTSISKIAYLIMYSRENLKKHEIYIDYFSLTIDMAALPSI